MNTYRRFNWDDQAASVARTAGLWGAERWLHLAADGLDVLRHVPGAGRLNRHKRREQVRRKKWCATRVARDARAT